MKVKNRTLKQTILIFVSILIMFTTITPGFARAEVSLYPFDSTNVLDDLTSSDDFILTEYLFDSTLEMSSAGIINFVEWCYSATQAQEDYALYVYFYNPQKLDIITTSTSNRIQLATKYGNGTPAYEDASPTDYKTFPLIYCNKSTKPGYEGMFYKFRIQFTTSEKQLILSNLVATNRRYDVSGIVLATKEKTIEFPIGGTFRFKGYAKGYGAKANAESTLESLEFLPFETIQLEVKSTNYRTNTSSLGKGHQNDITSVYFAVPKKFIYEEVYNSETGVYEDVEIANLQRIKAEWHEYKTEFIYVVGSEAAFNGVKQSVGQIVEGGYHSSVAGGYSLNYGWHPSPTELAPGFGFWDYSYNMNNIFATCTAGAPINQICWLFNCDEVDEYKVLVSKEQIEEYAKSYDASWNKGSLALGSNVISLDLFQNTVDAGRTRGYNVKEFDNTEDRFNILDYNSTHSWWEKWGDYGLFSKIEDEARENIAPIEMIKKSDVAMTDNNLSYTYLVGDKDIEDVRSFTQSAYENDTVPYIFHFAQTDYYSESGTTYKNALAHSDTQRSTMTVFLDFKIITLTFKQGEDYKVIPVVQDPIDIYNDVTENPDSPFFPKQENNFWNTFLAWIVLILACFAGAGLFFLELRVFRAISNVGKGPLKILVMIAAIAGIIALDALLVGLAKTWIMDLGGLGF